MNRREFLAASTGMTAAAIGAVVDPSTVGARSTSGGQATATMYKQMALNPSQLVGADELWSWVEAMVAVGPRLTGSRPHHEYLDWLQRRMESLGMRVSRYPVPLDQWLARRWSLEVHDARGGRHSIPVAFYRPHSGETPSRGITAELVDVGSGTDQDYASTEAAGRIVLADFSIARLPASVWGSFANYMYPPGVDAELAGEDYTRIWLGVPPPPSLELAKSRGAIGMIDILDMSSPLARGQFSPHQQEWAGLPTLHLDRDEGRYLRSLLALGPVEVTLVLDAVNRKTTVDYLGGSLHGSGDDSGSVLLMTHTDGQNAIEENGGPIILSLLDLVVRSKRRPHRRGVEVLLSPNHMTAGMGTVKPDEFLRRHPEIHSKVAMALVPEHLGTMAWDEDPATGIYGPTGQSEFAAVPVGNSEVLQQVAIDEIRASNLVRSGVMKPRDGGLYGEGTYPYLVGLPTIAYISGPSYLVQVEAGDNLDKLDRALMHRQTAFLARVLSRMLDLPSATP